MPVMTLRMMAVLAHPDDESLGVGGTLATYAAEGIETFVITATRGERGRYHGHPPGHELHPGATALAGIREAELRAASAVLGVRELILLGYGDQELDRIEPREAQGRIVEAIRRVRPQVVVTFGPDGAYGHPDHVAISQLATAAIVAAADGSVPLDASGSLSPHAVDKLYYLAMPEPAWVAYQSAFKQLVAVVDGVERQAVPWPEWEVTTFIDTRDAWTTVWRAVSCHDSQIAGYQALKELSPDHHAALWGRQSFYRVFSRVNGGRARETDLFDGLRG
jgi:LmbE family N-acetylglucosaminyl deacetylase